MYKSINLGVKRIRTSSSRRTVSHRFFIAFFEARYNLFINNLMHSRDIMDSEYNASRQTFFPWFSMDPLKNKNKTLTHGGVSYTRYDRGIIYDGACVHVCVFVTILLYKESVTDYGI